MTSWVFSINVVVLGIQLTKHTFDQISTSY